MKLKLNILILLFTLVITFSISCKKDYERNSVPQIKSALFALDFMHSTALMGLDFLINYEEDSIVFLPHMNGYHILWIDSSFDDGNGIEALLTFKPWNEDSIIHYYGNDHLVRKGTIRIKCLHPINFSQNEIEIIPEINFEMGYNPFKLHQIKSEFSIKRLNSLNWEVYASNFSSNINQSFIEGRFKSVLSIANNRIKNNEINNTLSFIGKVSGMHFEINSQKELTRRYISGCAMSFIKGQLDIKHKNEDWEADYNTFNNEPCDRMVKLKRGNKEYFIEIL
jgi:hypothetical protein